MLPEDSLSRREFSIYQKNPLWEIPQAQFQGTCAVGFDIQDGKKSTIRTSWNEIQTSLLELIGACPEKRQSGGYMYNNGLALVITNPTQISGYGTCMASAAAGWIPVPKRLNLVECISLSARPPPTAVHQAAPQGSVPSPDAVHGAVNIPNRHGLTLPPRRPSTSQISRLAHVAGTNAAVPNPSLAAQPRFELPKVSTGTPDQEEISRRPRGSSERSSSGAHLPNALSVAPGGAQEPSRGRFPPPRQDSSIVTQLIVPAAKRIRIKVVQGDQRGHPAIGIGSSLRDELKSAQGGAQAGVHGGVQWPAQAPAQMPAQGGAAREDAQEHSLGDSGLTQDGD
ncbi:hypothetical protein MMC30_005455 [Trapelia coarctata]|nr:hypothetical protein [Trapelia coarctata]